jgi:UDP:flavonoid glycosyltransferase YjiC (YdhE family)
MARIAFAWELGGSIGHALACAGLARALHARGHAIALMLRDLRPLALVPECDAYDVFQAPRNAREARDVGIPASYAEILLGCGYRDDDELAALVGGWRTLFGMWRPDLVIADFAPTALLAARSLDVRRATYGNGFFTPPRLTPLPAFRVDAPVDPERLRAADASALAGANAALARFGAAPMPTLAEMFAGDEDFLCTFPELDHYGSRPVSGYWGPRLRVDLGNEGRWPEGQGARVLVYVQKSTPHVDALIAALAEGPYRVLAYIPDIDDARRARLAARHRIVLERPVRLDSILKSCDLLVCHGGEIAGGALACGVPVLLMPSHYEQYLTARCIDALGCGGWLTHEATAGDVRLAVMALTSKAQFKAAARAYAARYPAYSPLEQRRRIVARVEDILTRSRAPEATR